jgi:hypothetical protein
MVTLVSAGGLVYTLNAIPQETNKSVMDAHSHFTSVGGKGCYQQHKGSWGLDGSMLAR